MVRYRREAVLAVGIVLGVLVFGLSSAQAVVKKFRLILKADDAAACDMTLPTAARATLRLHQQHGRTWVRIRLRHGVPKTFHTVWLKLDGASPLTQGGVTALANPDDIEALADVTPAENLAGGPLSGRGDDGSGSDDLEVHVNGFVTDEKGRGRLRMRLDFPIKKGAYQFQEFDQDLARVPIGDVPFTLRIASHCTDQVGHGLVPSDHHEPWFDWP